MTSPPSPRRLIPPAASVLRRRSGRLTTRRAVQQAIVSVASLIGAPVFNQRGQRVGRIVDLVARMHGQDRYPPLTGLLLQVGSRNSRPGRRGAARRRHCPPAPLTTADQAGLSPRRAGP